MCLFLLAVVVAYEVAPGLVIELQLEMQQRGRSGLFEAGGGGATPRRPALMPEAEPDVGPGGILFQVTEPKPENSHGTAFKVGGGTLWLTANHVVDRCDTVGLDMGLLFASAVTRGDSIPQADIAAIYLPAHVPQSLELASSPPQPGDAGYHMGFPQGRRAVVISRYMGEAQVAIGHRGRSPVLMWVQVQRIPDFRGTLAGISGGPVLNRHGALVGVNIAVSERRGRVLTAPPAAIASLLVAEDAVTFSTASGQAAQPEELNPITARYLVRALDRAGTLRRVFCEVGK